MKKLLLPFLLVSVIFLVIDCTPQPQESSQAEGPRIPAPQIKRLSEVQYGIIVDDYEVIQDKIERNQFLADILTPHNVDWQTIDAIARKSAEVYDVKKMKAGNPFTILKARNASDVDYFIYEKDKKEFVVFDLRDGVQVYEGKKEIIREEKQASGIVYSSLYETIQENNLDVNLSAKLEEIYAWSLDFFHLQKGDFFKIIYDEEFVEGEPIGIGDIKAAQFHHAGRDFYAITFEQDGKTDFYDEEGNSLRKEFLKAPLRYSRISSGYTTRRFHPILKRYRAHLGVDYAAPHGTPIYAIGDGVVTNASYSKGNGRYVKIRHNSIYTTQYLHMSGFAKGIKEGKAVRQGEVIGYVGSTGLATGPHLCFRFWKNGSQVNPRTIESPPSEPVKTENLLTYSLRKEEMLGRLSHIPLKETFAEEDSPSSTPLAEAQLQQPGREGP